MEKYTSPTRKRTTIIEGTPIPGKIIGVEGLPWIVKNARLHWRDRERRIKDIFTKRLHDSACNEGAGYSVLEKWRWLKKRGFPVVPSMRFDPKRNELLMSDITQEGKYVIIDKHTPLQKSSVSINNGEALKEQLRKVAVRAFDKGNGVLLHRDAYSVVVDQEGIGQICLLDLGIGSYRVNHGKIILPQDVPIVDIWDWREYTATVDGAKEWVENFIQECF